MRSVDEFRRLETHIHGSVLFRRFDDLAAAAVAAAAYARVTRRLREVRERFAARSATERVRAVAVFVATAAFGHLLLLAVVPAHIAPATPKTLWIVLGAAAMFTAVCADRFVAAWPSSRVRAWWCGASR
jgi:hypothetical protein